MAERKFTRNLTKPGMAAQLRETVSQVVRESTVHNKPQLVDPIDFEHYISKHKTLLQNDPHRELLLYPTDDVSQVVLPRKHRTSTPPKGPDPESKETTLTKDCLKTYSSNWHLVHYKYSVYSGSYLELPKISKADELKDEIYEVDTDIDQVDEADLAKNTEGITKQGFLLKGPQVGSDRIFSNIGSKSFKRRYCYLRQEVDGTYILELHKDDKKGEAKVTIVMDFCTEVVRNPKRGRFCFELRMPPGHKSHCLAADNESELQDWLKKLQQVLQHYSQQEEKRAASLERDRSHSSASPVLPLYGTLKGLDQSMNPQLMKYSRETDVSIALARKENRRRLFSLYPQMPHVNHQAPCQPETSLEPYKEHFGLRFIVRCESIKFRLQLPIDGEKEDLCQVEPYFTTLALYDARAGRKLSENFHFDVNHEQARSMLPNDHDSNENEKNGIDTNGVERLGDNWNLPSELQKDLKEWALYPQQALFNVSVPHSDIFLVLRIEKVLQGGICPTTEPYVRSTKDPRLGLKVHKNVKTCCQRLGRYRMPFAWAARPLFRLGSNNLDTSSEFPAIYRQEQNRLGDDELLKILADYRKPDKWSRLTAIPGCVKMSIEAVSDLPENCLSTSLSLLKPFPNPPNNECTREVSELEGIVDEKDVHPYTSYVSHLYVYPQSLNFDTQKTFSRARNIACVIQLRDSDEEDAQPLCTIYGHPGEDLLVTEACCAIIHHSTTPTWYEETKIRLPTLITNKHHLLFTFYHISCDPSKKKEISVETCVGYAWLPLLHKGRINVDEQNLSVAASLPPGYLAVQPLGLGKGVSTMDSRRGREHVLENYTYNDSNNVNEVTMWDMNWAQLNCLTGGDPHRTYGGPEMNWIDGQRPIFVVRFQLLSSVLTRDPHLHNLFAHAERLQETLPGHPLPSENETCKILKAAHAVQLSAMIAFLPTLLNQLMNLLVTCNGEEIGLNIIRLIIHIVHMVHGAEREELLKIYVKFVFVAPTSPDGTRTVHDEMSLHLQTLLRPHSTDFLTINKFMWHSDFFFQIMAKSMAQYLLKTNRIKMVRNERFSPEYQQRIEKLIDDLQQYLVSHFKEAPTETKELNCSIARFLKKCLTLTDRGYTFRLVKSYMEHIKADESRTLFDYKFTFLQILCSHEHYVAFNLPVAPSHLSKTRCADLVSRFVLCEDFCRHHYLAGMLIEEVRSALQQVAHVRRVAVCALRDLVAKHELDDRYQAKGQLGRIASLYTPWLGVVLENLNRLNASHDTSGNSLGAMPRSSTSSYISTLTQNGSGDAGRPCFSRVTQNFDRASTRASTYLRDANYFAAIAGQGMVNGCSTASVDSGTSTVISDAISTASQETAIMVEDGFKDETIKTHSRSVSSSQPVRVDKLQPTEVKDVLVCYLFVVKYLSEDQLIAWWQLCSHTELLNFFRLLEMCLHQFKYTGRKQIANSPSNGRDISHPGKPQTARSMTLPARMTPPDFSSDNFANNQTSPTHSQNQNQAITIITPTTTITLPSGSSSVGREPRENLALKSGKEGSERTRLYQALLEANMATEVGLIALDILGLYCTHMKDSLTTSNPTNPSVYVENPLMNKVFDILLSFLQVGQSETLFRHVFAALRAFINNFSQVLFQGGASFCGRLCYEILRCCNSRLSSIRQEACAILYLLMRSNFEFTNRKGLTRVHLQVIISVSQMLGNVVGLNNARFQESLSLINSYASSDKVMKGTGFPIEVKDLTKRIRTVLMATAQMREHHQDPEMLVALQHSLANSYATTPELRNTWLQSMSRNHVRDGNLSEAACCQLHIAALMAEYLKLKKVQDWGAAAFAKISSNIAKDEVGLKLDAGVQDTQYTEQSLLEQLELCAEHLDRAERYECLGELYRLIIPQYEKARNYGALAQAYQTLSKAYLKVTEVNRSRKRLLGRYYRVVFHGQGYFEEESGVEYVYKEPKVASLAEVSDRLYRLYTAKFGEGVVKIIKDSAPVDVNDLDPKFAYIQVTHVVPYFDKTDLEERITDFEQNHDIFRFKFETPFTLDGRPQGAPEEQWKRRTILTLEKSFPYVTKRIKTLSRTVLELSPIEVALDEMQIKVAEIEEVVLAQPTDAKKLQLRLQGSVCVQVNAGPLAYATAFLDSSKSGSYPEEKVEELRDVYRDFIKICYTALQINSKLVSADQQEYQEALRQNYHKMVQDLSPFFSESIWPDEEPGSFKRNSQALFSAISGASANSSTV